MADYAICMQLLLLYSTTHPPPDRTRQYLHNAAEYVDNWNDVSLPIREFCMLRQKELREAEANLEKIQLEEDRQRRADMLLRKAQEEAEQRQAEEADLRSQWEEDERRREAEDKNRRQEQDMRMKEEWEAKHSVIEERRSKAEQERSVAQAERQRLEDEQAQREEEERSWRQEYEERMRVLRKSSSQSLKTSGSMVRQSMSHRTPSSSSLTSNAALKPQMGVEIKMLDDSEGKPDCVVCVESVTPGGPCHTAGLQHEDFIDRWNGERLYSKPQWADKVKNSKPGDRVMLTLFRGTNQLELPVIIGGTTKAFGSVRSVRSHTSTAGPGRRQPTATSSSGQLKPARDDRALSMQSSAGSVEMM